MAKNTTKDSPFLLSFFTVILAMVAKTAYPITSDCSLTGVTHRFGERFTGMAGFIILAFDVPAFGKKDEWGQFLWLVESMNNNNAIANMSETKLSMHAGTHVDAPDHMFDHYFDVDSIGLEVLNTINKVLAPLAMESPLSGLIGFVPQF